MPFIILDSERFALPIGETSLGGSADDAVPIPALAALPPTALVFVGPDGVVTIQRTGDRPVLVDGRAVGGEPVPLVHGAKVVVGHVHLTFGDLHETGSTSRVAGVTDDQLSAFGALPSVPTADAGGRVARSDGTVFPIPEHGLVIGRDPGLDLVLTGKGVSRRHATIRPTIQGYILTDEGANGTLVNGRKVDGSQRLGMGDIIRIGSEELRFEADPAPPDAQARPGEPAVPAAGRSTPVADTRSGRSLLATLEIVNSGVLKGTRFRIERPAVHIGRGEYNEIRLEDKSVSAAHATLTRRGAGWFVLDLGSTNGTYLDGERVTGESRIAGAAELRFGDIKMLFRPIAGAADDEGSTRAVVGLRDDEIA